MIAKFISIALVFLLATSAPRIAAAQAREDTKQIQTIKEKIGKAQATGKTTVSVTIRDGGAQCG